MRKPPKSRFAKADLSMSFKTKLLFSIAGAVLAALAVTAPAQALTTRECVEKYKVAQSAGTLRMKWVDFRKAECGTDTTPAAAPPAPAAPKAAK